MPTLWQTHLASPKDHHIPLHSARGFAATIHGVSRHPFSAGVVRDLPWSFALSIQRGGSSRPSALFLCSQSRLFAKYLSPLTRFPITQRIRLEHFQQTDARPPQGIRIARVENVLKAYAVLTGELIAIGESNGLSFPYHFSVARKCASVCSVVVAVLPAPSRPSLASHNTAAIQRHCKHGKNRLRGLHMVCCSVDPLFG